MPAGFGIYDGDRSTTAETQVLQAGPARRRQPGRARTVGERGTRGADDGGRTRLTRRSVSARDGASSIGHAWEAGDAALRCLRRQRPKRRASPRLRRGLASRNPRIARDLPYRNAQCGGRLARAGEAPKPAASLLRHRFRPSREPQRSRVRPFPSAQVSPGSLLQRFGAMTGSATPAWPCRRSTSAPAPTRQSTSSPCVVQRPCTSAMVPGDRPARRVR